MNALAVLLLASLPVPQVQLDSAQRIQAPHFAKQAQDVPRNNGKWYLARTGHAVFCVGPVMTVSNASGGLERVAPFCRGDQMLVPLKD